MIDRELIPVQATPDTAASTEATWADAYEVFGIPPNPGEGELFDVRTIYTPRINPILEMALANRAADGEPDTGHSDSALTAVTSQESALLQAKREKEFVGASHLVRAVLAEDKAREMTANYKKERIDKLTGFYNRGALFEQAEALHDSLDEQDSLAVIFIDLDGLKTTNDTRGHAAGNILLTEFSDHIKGKFPDKLIGRIGGDEFVFILGLRRPVGISDADWQLAIDQEITDVKTNAREGWSSTVSDKGFSIGSSVGTRKNGHEFNSYINELLETADQEMYTDKTQRNSKVRRSRFSMARRFFFPSSNT